MQNRIFGQIFGIIVSGLDLDIRYRPGNRISRADALSRYPMEPHPDGHSEGHTPPVIAAVRRPEEPTQSGEGEVSLGERQRRDSQLGNIIDYLES